MKSGYNWRLPITSPHADSPSKMSRRFKLAMLTYTLLALLAAFTLDGQPRTVTLIVLGGFALKTYIVVLKDRAD